MPTSQLCDPAAVRLLHFGLLGPEAKSVVVKGGREIPTVGEEGAYLLVDRIGDIVAVARGALAIVRTQAEPGLSALPGQHGGLTPDEQWVPLLLAHNP